MTMDQNHIKLKSYLVTCIAISTISLIIVLFHHSLQRSQKFELPKPASSKQIKENLLLKMVANKLGKLSNQTQ